MVHHGGCWAGRTLAVRESRLLPVLYNPGGILVSDIQKPNPGKYRILLSQGLACRPLAAALRHTTKVFSSKIPVLCLYPLHHMSRILCTSHNRNQNGQELETYQIQQQHSATLWSEADPQHEATLLHAAEAVMAHAASCRVRKLQLPPYPTLKPPLATEPEATLATSYHLRPQRISLARLKLCSTGIWNNTAHSNSWHDCH